LNKYSDRDQLIINLANQVTDYLQDFRDKYKTSEDINADVLMICLFRAISALAKEHTIPIESLENYFISTLNQYFSEMSLEIYVARYLPGIKPKKSELN
jgi:hypothetical protein